VWWRFLSCGGDEHVGGEHARQHARSSRREQSGTYVQDCMRLGLIGKTPV
jgi:hypothetical protein